MDLIAKELARLTKRGKGVLAPSAVVEAARNPESPLHAEFEWSDSVAAEKYRLNQARVLIRSVRVEIHRNDIEIAAPAYVQAPDKESGHDQGYRRTQQVADNEAMARAAMASELKAARAYLARAERLADALGLREDTQLALDALDAIAVRLEADAA